MTLPHHAAASTLAASETSVRTVSELVLAGRYPGGRPAQPPILPAATDMPGDLTRPIWLPAADDRSRTRSLASVIGSRRSGGLTAGPVGSSELGTLLAWATAAAEDCLVSPDLTFRPAIYPIVLAIDAIPTGAYRYVPDLHALAPIRAVDRHTVGETAILQHEHRTGTALLFLVVPLSRWLATFGDRGYRGAAFAAGWLTDRLYLVAETLGLTYTATGGFAPAVIDELLGLDGCERTAFFAFAIGGPRYQDSRSQR
jgi:SagB-type dehydrogenase family enzyme